MNTKQIDYILELSQTKNFNRAAENLYISQPTLTYQINEVEKEIGFKIFERTGKGANLTPAGEQFCTSLRGIKDQLKNAIEQGQNFSSKYQENIVIGLPLRSVLYYLPHAIKSFSNIHPEISVTPQFNGLYRPEPFLKGEQDIYFSFGKELNHAPDTKIHPLFKSRIYLICNKDDSLAKKDIIKIKDLKNRTLMVGGGSPPELQRVQQRVINELHIDYFNSPNHETTLTNVASNKGICLAPGFMNEHYDEFAWIPFECEETFNCVLCTHASDKRESIKEFIKILQELYKNADVNL